MSYVTDIQDPLSIIGGHPSINVAFVMSEHGSVETTFPERSHPRAVQWSEVLMPLLRSFLTYPDFRYVKVQYKQGELWIWLIPGGRLLLLVTQTEFDERMLFDQISPEIQKIISISSGVGENESNLDVHLQKLLHEATGHIKLQARSEEGFFGALRQLAFSYFGVLGEEWVDQSLEALWLTIPVQQKRQMESLLAEITKHIAHPIKRVAFHHDAELLIKQFSPD